MPDNTLYYGNNLDILERYVPNESVDLIYLDPPFNSKRAYNVMFPEHNGAESEAQINAFGDTWYWGPSSQSAYEDVLRVGGDIAQTMKAFRELLGDNNTMAYLAMMAPRLLELRRVLRGTGSIYLHCDPTASHYLKVLMDSIFGTSNFLNEVVWHYGLGNARGERYFHRKHDILLFYAAGPGYRFNQLRGGITEAQRKKYCHEDERGHYMMSYGRKYYLKGGKPLDDVWDIPTISPTSSERLGYPTQKPQALLERIIAASSREGDTVLDPFCGCGTAVVAAQHLERRWIGIDVTYLAIAAIKRRLSDAFAGEAVFDIVGEPVCLADARKLAKDEPYQFQWWALDLVGARPVDQKKGPDKGIDGRLFFVDGAEGGRGDETKQIILSVKGGGLKADDVRALHSVVERVADMGVLITLSPPTRGMVADAASAGFYESPSGNRYQKVQIMTIEDLLSGKTIDMPAARAANITLRRAPRLGRERPVQRELIGPE